METDIRKMSPMEEILTRGMCFPTIGWDRDGMPTRMYGEGMSQGVSKDMIDTFMAIPLDDMPLYVNDTNLYKRLLATWRMKQPR